MNETRNDGGSVTVGLPETLGDLIHSYKTDPLSGWHRLRYHVRKNHEDLLRRLVNDHGSHPLSEIRARDLLGWHQTWCGPEGKKLGMAHSFMGKLRTISAFGVVMLEHPECTRLSLILNKMRFPGRQSRKSYLTAEQVINIRDEARKIGWYSMALTQALQFELMLRQKDCLGEYVPIEEPGESDIIRGGQKWLRGLRWEEIDSNLILKHVTSKRQKELVVDLNHYPMVLEEFRHVIELYGELPKVGPVVLEEATGMPWLASEYRRKWRIVANRVGVPKDVCSMDSRAGGVTEASQAGALLEHIKHAATHSDIAMTQRYSRGAEDKIAAAQQKRLEYRQAQFNSQDR